MSCAAAKFSAGVPQHDVVDGAGDGVEIELEAARGRVALADATAAVAKQAHAQPHEQQTRPSDEPGLSLQCVGGGDVFHARQCAGARKSVG
jgi:hypothetical protein